MPESLESGPVGIELAIRPTSHPGGGVIDALIARERWRQPPTAMSLRRCGQRNTLFEAGDGHLLRHRSEINKDEAVEDEPAKSFSSHLR